MSKGQKRRINSVVWSDESGGRVHLVRDWRSFDTLPPLYLGHEQSPLVSLSQESPLEYGKRAHYCYSKRTLQFMVDPARSRILILRKISCFWQVHLVAGQRLWGIELAPKA